MVRIHKNVSGVLVVFKEVLWWDTEGNKKSVR